MRVAGNLKGSGQYFSNFKMLETKYRTCDLCVAGIRFVKTLTVCYLHQKQLVKHFQAAGKRCFYQRALESFIKNDFISTK